MKKYRDEDITYVPIEDMEDERKTQPWMLPESPDQIEFVRACGARRFRPGQKSQVLAISKAMVRGRSLGKPMYAAVLVALEGMASSILEVKHLPPIPRSWWEWRLEQAREHHWSLHGLLRALLDRDRLVEHCQYQLRKEGKNGRGREERATSESSEDSTWVNPTAEDFERSL